MFQRIFHKILTLNKASTHGIRQVMVGLASELRSLPYTTSFMIFAGTLIL
jgi:hypothetical protein